MDQHRCGKVFAPAGGHNLDGQACGLWQAPLLTAEERRDQAIQKVTAGMTLSDEQQRWMDRIRAHLVENLSIDREDFEILPVFARAGGWNKADMMFKGDLGSILNRFNREVAA